MPALKVLVIDDDPVVLALSQAALEHHGHEVVTLEGAIGAMAVVLRERPRVIVVDMQMPGLSGDEWLRMLRDRKLLGDDGEIAVILHSGARAAELEKLVVEMGALGAIVKKGDAHGFAKAFEVLVSRLPRER